MASKKRSSRSSRRSQGINAAKVQDAYHYAREAAGWDSAFTGSRHNPPRSVFLRKANRVAREAGLHVKSARTLKDAAALAVAIRAAARAAGIDADSGSSL
jgi:hypothetical protein